MKGIGKFLVIGMALLFMSGCEKQEELQVTKCTLKNNNISAKYSLNAEYSIYSKKDIVNTVEVKEKVISSSSAIIDYFEKYLTTLYSTSNNTYGGYNNKIVKENDELTSTTTINYEQMNLEKYVEDNPTIENYVNDKNELTLEGVKSIYTSLGAICE